MADTEHYISSGEQLFKDTTETTALKLTQLRNNYGKNLIQHSAFWDINDDDLPVMWSLRDTPTLVIATDTLFPSRGGNQITITSVGDTYEGINIMGGTSNWLKVLPSTTYTFSVDYKVTAGDYASIYIRGYDGASGGTAYVFDSTLTETTSTRYSVTFTTTAVDNLHIRLTAKNNGDIVIFSHPKLEQGSIATPYVLNEAEEQANIIQYYNCNFRAYAASDQDNITDATWVQAVLGTESFDGGSDFASNEGVLPITGFYEFDGCVSFENTDAAADKLYGGAIYIDPLGAGSDAAVCYDYRTPSLATQPVTCHPHIYDKFNKTDEVRLYGYANTGGATQDIESGSANTYLSGRLVKLDI